MATDLHKPAEQPNAETAAAPTAGDNLAPQNPAQPTAKPRGREAAEKAKAKYTEQKQNAAARLRDWFAAADISDVKLAEQIVKQKQNRARQADDNLVREVGRLRARLAQARITAARQHGDADAKTPEVERIRAELAAAEARIQIRDAEGPALAVVPPTNRELDRARWARKAMRTGGVLVAAIASLKGVSAEPELLLLSFPVGGFGWWYLSRPRVSNETADIPVVTTGGQQVPFVQAPTGNLPATLQAAPMAPARGEAPSTGQPVMLVEQLAEGGKPFPLAQAHTPEQVAECVLRALLAEGVPVVEVSDVVRQPWGWQCIVRVGEGTPEAIIKATGDLETRLDLAANGVRPQPMIERRACTVLRLVDRGANPFATAPGLPYRAPKSMSITDRFRIGTSVGGDPLDLSLAGVMGLWVAASGGGKTGILQALAEGTTACYDNITVDLDPHGDGLEDLHDAVRITARTHEQIEAVLLFFLMMSKARARLRAKLGMGKKWKASPEHPAVTIFFDEFPKATDLAKRLAFDLLLVGRKELIEVEIASQGGTKLYLGENIAQMIAMKGIGPCKVGDTRAVFGDGAVAEGWLPHKLSPATDTDPKDAGHIFIQGVPGRPDEPIEYAIHETPSATLRQLATERLEAGLVEPDQDSLDGMRAVDLPEYVEPVYDVEGNLKKEAPVELLTWAQLLKLCGAEPAATPDLQSGPARTAVEDAVTVMEKAGVDRMKTETLLLALRDYDGDTYGEMLLDELKSLLKEAGAGTPITLGPIGEDKNPRGFKRDRLRHLL